MSTETETKSLELMAAWIKAFNAIEKKHSSSSNEASDSSTDNAFEDYVPEGFYDEDLEEISAMTDEEVRRELEEIGQSEASVANNISALTSEKVSFLRTARKDKDSALDVHSTIMTEVIKDSIGKSFIYSQKEESPDTSQEGPTENLPVDIITDKRINLRYKKPRCFSRRLVGMAASLLLIFTCYTNFNVITAYVGEQPQPSMALAHKQTARNSFYGRHERLGTNSSNLSSEKSILTNSDEKGSRFSNDIYYSKAELGLITNKTRSFIDNGTSRFVFAGHNTSIEGSYYQFASNENEYNDYSNLITNGNEYLYENFTSNEDSVSPTVATRGSFGDEKDNTTSLDMRGSPGDQYDNPTHLAIRGSYDEPTSQATKGGAEVEYDNHTDPATRGSAESKYDSYPELAMKEHTVIEGETLSGIMIQHGLNIWDSKFYSVSNTLNIGDKIKICTDSFDNVRKIEMKKHNKPFEKIFPLPGNQLASATNNI